MNKEQYRCLLHDLIPYFEAKNAAALPWHEKVAIGRRLHELNCFISEACSRPILELFDDGG